MTVSSGPFNIYTREAGAGGLSMAVEGPSKAEIDFQDKKDGSCEVAYTCTEPGLIMQLDCLSHVKLQQYSIIYPVYKCIRVMAYQQDGAK